MDILGGSCINGIICLYESWYDDYDDDPFRPSYGIQQSKNLRSFPRVLFIVHLTCNALLTVLDLVMITNLTTTRLLELLLFGMLDLISDSNGPYCPPLVEVYTLSTDSWRQTEARLDASVKAIYCRSQFYLNGAYHWHGSIHDRPYDVIVSFDMTAEIFQIIRLPNLDDNDNASDRKVFWPEFSVFHNCIAMIVYDIQTDGNRENI
jgi:hypothetical protein